MAAQCLELYQNLYGKELIRDENNMCSWAMRCLLIELENKLILIDTGIGNKQNEKFFSFFYLHGKHNLKQSIEKAGFSTNEVTDVKHIYTLITVEGL